MMKKFLYCIGLLLILRSVSPAVVGAGEPSAVLLEDHFEFITATAFTIDSSSFADGELIPEKFTCNGDNISPQLSWSNPPPGTTSYALIMDDELPPCGTGDNACRHWMVYNIPASTDGFSENQPITAISGLTEGRAFNNVIDYAGPCPPSRHTYKFTLYALKDSMPVVNSGTALTRSQFQARFASHILASATIEGVYP